MDSDVSPGPRSASVLETLPLSVATLDEDGVIVDTNREWREFGAENGAAGSPAGVGDDYLEVTDRAAEDGDADARRAAGGLRNVLAGRRASFSMEYPCHSPSERRWFLLWAGGFTDRGERFAAVVHLDITDRVLAERRVERQRDEIATERERLALVNQLLRHDVRNDLNLVTGFGDVLAEYVPPAGEEYLEGILDAAGHTLELIEAAGDFAAFVEGADDSLAPTDLSAVLATEIEQLRAEYEGRSTSVTITDPGSLPSGVEVMATPLLSSVFSNLLSNAVFHNDEADVRIDVDVEEREDSVVVRVADNGPGVPDERKRALFEEGQKRAESPGSGLGLHLVDTLVGYYGGSAWIEDAEPKGAVFCVELRRA